MQPCAGLSDPRLPALSLLALSLFIGVAQAQLSGDFDQDLQHSGRSLLQDADAHNIAVHGWLMGTAWALLIPLGITIAVFRNVLKLSPWWFYLHITLQTLGFLLSLAGVGVGAQLRVNNTLKRQHRIIGITVNTLAGVQWLLAIIWRPAQTRQLRRVWNLTHWTFGRCAMALALANIYIGLHISHPGARYIAGATIVYGVLFLVVVFKNSIQYLLVPIPPSEEAAGIRALEQRGDGRRLPAGVGTQHRDRTPGGLVGFGRRRAERTPPNKDSSSSDGSLHPTGTTAV